MLLVKPFYAGHVIRVADSRRHPMGTKWYGERGWIHVDRGRLDAEPKSLLKEKIGPDEILLYESSSHQGNFLECVKER